jgi:hypothetical protein
VTRWAFRVSDAGLLGFVVGLLLIPWFIALGEIVLLAGIALTMVAFVMLAWPRR